MVHQVVYHFWYFDCYTVATVPAAMAQYNDMLTCDDPEIVANVTEEELRT